jgi:hypothetical protein
MENEDRPVTVEMGEVVLCIIFSCCGSTRGDLISFFSKETCVKFPVLLPSVIVLLGNAVAS